MGITHYAFRFATDLCSDFPHFGVSQSAAVQYKPDLLYDIYRNLQRSPFLKIKKPVGILSYTPPVNTNHEINEPLFFRQTLHFAEYTFHLVNHSASSYTTLRLPLFQNRYVCLWRRIFLPGAEA